MSAITRIASISIEGLEKEVKAWLKKEQGIPLIQDFKLKASALGGKR